MKSACVPYVLRIYYAIIEPFTFLIRRCPFFCFLNLGSGVAEEYILEIQSLEVLGISVELPTSVHIKTEARVFGQIVDRIRVHLDQCNPAPRGLEPEHDESMQ